MTTLTLTLPTVSVGPTRASLVVVSAVHTAWFVGGTERAALSGLEQRLRALWTVEALTLRPLTQHLAALTRAELTPRTWSLHCLTAVPHVAMVTHHSLVVATAFEQDTLLAALAGASDRALTLGAGERGAGPAVAPGGSSVAHTGGAGVLLPLLTVLVLLSRRQTGVGHTLGTALTRTNHQVLVRSAGDGFTLGHRALHLSIGADASRTQARLELLPVTKLSVLPATRASVADTLRTTLALRCVEPVVLGTVQSRTGQSRTGHSSP